LREIYISAALIYLIMVAFFKKVKLHARAAGLLAALLHEIAMLMRMVACSSTYV
jgi:ABC-type transport system involved in cytochrome c biogenesis permease subunit